ncbi:alpha/beta hydrolase family protein [Chitinophaga caeni]|nr:prolyl oligopeptidase family serine peptidase [Chitinophaga caeni]
MKKYINWLSCLMVAAPMSILAQSKKPLDHSVYDGWQNIGQQKISTDGHWILYNIDVQEGDDQLVIKSTKDQTTYLVDRGYNGNFSFNNQYMVCSVKPHFKDLRQAKIDKKKPNEMPHDSLVVLNLASGIVERIADVKSYAVAEEGGDVFAYQRHPQKDTTHKKKTTGNEAEKSDAAAPYFAPPRGGKDNDEGSLIIRKFDQKFADTLEGVSHYEFNRPGSSLLIVKEKTKKDSLSAVGLAIWMVDKRDTKFISYGDGMYKQFNFDKRGEQVAFVVSRDSSKALQHFYELKYYQPKLDSAETVVTNASPGIPRGWGVSENGRISFSDDGSKLFFGTAPIRPPKDTSIVDFEVAKVDIWHYQDDYLQPMQLKNLDRELKRTYTAVYYPASNKYLQLSDGDLENIRLTQDKNATYALGFTDKGNRIRMQWTGSTLKKLYAVNTETGAKTLIVDNLDSYGEISPSGKYITWYDQNTKQWNAYEIASQTTRVITKEIPQPLYDVENDVPDAPRAYGIACWSEDDQSVFIYDQYDIWQVDPKAGKAPFMITGGYGRSHKTRLRYERLDPEQYFVSTKDTWYLEAFNDTSKYSGYFTYNARRKKALQEVIMAPFAYRSLRKAKNASYFTFTKSTYEMSPNVFGGKDIADATQYSQINPQQANYNWGTAELYTWTTFKGHKSTGILYKPEDFNPGKKYPVLLYFYEKLSDGLYNYQAPAPTPSRLNISFFVSRGYIVFAPDITYEKGQPGESAYDYIVSGAESLTKLPYIDGKNMGIQGQSWGGYQVAYLITRTNLFKAAWSGAPVANMTSAYGGIRWGSGMNRQFQYELGQSRIGATLWEDQEAYIANSPLFHLPNVETPVVIMANDGDGAVPWYQGIEMFTGLRRLGKPTWLLNYNNDEHNLMMRQNRKDIQRREQQFFDYYLKGGPNVEWIKYGVPATEKGIDWGWDTVK